MYKCCILLLVAILGLSHFAISQDLDQAKGFNPEAGIFVNQIGFTNPPAFGPYNFYRHKTVGNTQTYRLLNRGVLVKELTMTCTAVNWMVFPRQNYLIVKHIDVFSHKATYYLYVVELTSGAYHHYKIGPYGGFDASLTLNPSLDGKAFFIFVGYGNNTSDTHKVIRSDSGRVLCEVGYAYHIMGQRLALITNNHTVRIIIGPNIDKECPLPAN